MKVKSKFYVTKWILFILIMFSIGYYSIPTIKTAIAEARLEYGLVINSVEAYKAKWDVFDNN